MESGNGATNMAWCGTGIAKALMIKDEKQQNLDALSRGLKLVCYTEPRHLANLCSEHVLIPTAAIHTCKQLGRTYQQSLGSDMPAA